MCLWRWKVRRALLDGLKGIIVNDNQARKIERRVVIEVRKNEFQLTEDCRDSLWGDGTD